MKCNHVAKHAKIPLSDTACGWTETAQDQTEMWFSPLKSHELILFVPIYDFYCWGKTPTQQSKAPDRGKDMHFNERCLLENSEIGFAGCVQTAESWLWCRASNYLAKCIARKGPGAGAGGALLLLQVWGWAPGCRSSCWSDFLRAKGQQEQEGAFGGGFCLFLS